MRFSRSSIFASGRNTRVPATVSSRLRPDTMKRHQSRKHHQLFTNWTGNDVTEDNTYIPVPQNYVKNRLDFPLITDSEKLSSIEYFCLVDIEPVSKMCRYTNVVKTSAERTTIDYEKIPFARDATYMVIAKADYEAARNEDRTAIIKSQLSYELRIINDSINKNNQSYSDDNEQRPHTTDYNSSKKPIIKYHKVVRSVREALHFEAIQEVLNIFGGPRRVAFTAHNGFLYDFKIILCMIRSCVDDSVDADHLTDDLLFVDTLVAIKRSRLYKCYKNSELFKEAQDETWTDFYLLGKVHTSFNDTAMMAIWTITFGLDLTGSVTDGKSLKKFYADSLTCKKRRTRHHTHNRPKGIGNRLEIKRPKLR